MRVYVRYILRMVTCGQYHIHQIFVPGDLHIIITLCQLSCRRRRENVSLGSIYVVHKIMCKKIFRISVKTYIIILLLLCVRPRDAFPSDSLE